MPKYAALSVQPGYGNLSIGTTTPRQNTTVHVLQTTPLNAEPEPYAVLGEATGIGVRGTATNTGVYGVAAIGVRGDGETVGVRGVASNPQALAGNFDGRVNVNGELTLRLGNKLGIGTDTPQVLLHAVGRNRIRLDGGAGHTLDLRSDGAALDMQGDNEIWINGNRRPVKIPNLQQPFSPDLTENISGFTIEEAIEALDDLKPISFNWKDDEEKTTCLGFDAEDAPEIATASDKTSIVPTHILAILSKVVQEQQRQINSMRQAFGQQSTI